MDWAVKERGHSQRRVCSLMGIDPRTRAPMTIPQGANQRWSVDFASDTLVDSRRFRVLCVIDDFTRECLGYHRRQLHHWGAGFDRTGPHRPTVWYPLLVVSNNGTKFTSNAMLGWQQNHRVDWHYIAPGKPMQNGLAL